MISWPSSVTTRTEYCASCPFGPLTVWLRYTVATSGIEMVVGPVPIG
jgi:hypothetical protein